MKTKTPPPAALTHTPYPKVDVKKQYRKSECGCIMLPAIRFENSDPTGKLKCCHLHATAPELLEIVQFLNRWVETGNMVSPSSIMRDLPNGETMTLGQCVKEVLSKIEGRA